VFESVINDIYPGNADVLVGLLFADGDVGAPR